MKTIFLLFIILLNKKVINCEKPKITEVSLDESKTSRLKLTIRWNTKLSHKLDRFLVEYDKMVLNPQRFGWDRKPMILSDSPIKSIADYQHYPFFTQENKFQEKSEYNCAMKCYDSDCNIYKYSPSLKMCYLFNYDKYATIVTTDDEDEIRFDISENFADYCEITSINCKKIENYRNFLTVDISPLFDYKFRIKVRNINKEWSDFKEIDFKFTPNITINLKGELMLNNPVTLECSINLHETLVNSIRWTNDNSNKTHKQIVSYEIDALKFYHHNESFMCEAEYSLSNDAKLLLRQKVRKSYLLEIKNIGDLKTSLDIQSNVFTDNLTVVLDFKTKIGDEILLHPPERILITYFDGKKYETVTKYNPFKISYYDQLLNSYSQKSVTNELECKRLCLFNLNCNHYVYNRNIKNDNCQWGHNSGYNRFRCGYNESCNDLIPLKNISLNSNRVSIQLLPNLAYIFKIEVKYKGLEVISSETKEFQILGNVELIGSGSTIFLKNDTKEYELLCKINLSKNIYNSKFEDVIFLKDGFYISAWNDLKYRQYTSNKTDDIHKYLKFNFGTTYGDISTFNGNYSCIIRLQSQDFVQFESYSSPVNFIEFTKKIDTIYNQSIGSIVLPKLPGNKLVLACKVTAYPTPEIQWIFDNKKLPSMYEAYKYENQSFTLDTIIHDTSTTLSAVYINLNNATDVSKYKCMMNNSITINDLQITIIDHSPKLEVKLNKSSLNRLKVRFEMKLTSESADNQFYNEYNEKPVKYRITYNLTNMNSSRIDDAIKQHSRNLNSSLVSENIRLYGIGSYYDHNLNAESCRLICLYNPLCKSYAFLPASCFLITTQEWANSFNEFTTKLNNTANFPKNLEHSLITLTSSIENMHPENLEEYNEINKKYDSFDCFDNFKFGLCNGIVDDISNPFELNLLPDSTYQFQVEAINIFGKVSYKTEPIYVPFPLNDEIIEYVNENETSLYCETSLTFTAGLSFKWYKNDEELVVNNENKIEIKKNTNEYFSTIIKFQTPKKGENNVYTCSLIFSTEEYTTVKNATFEYHHKYLPIYKKENDVEEIQNIYTHWNSTCSAEGYPLPKIDWYFNDQLISSSASKHDAYHIVRLRDNFFISKELVIHNLTESTKGSYSCKLNGKEIIKSINLIVKNDQAKFGTKKMLISIFIGVSIFVIIILTVGGVYLRYRKRLSREDNHTSLQYNNLREDSITSIRAEEAIENLIPVESED